jgi:hypothetical protein
MPYATPTVTRVVSEIESAGCCVFVRPSDQAAASRPQVDPSVPDPRAAASTILNNQSAAISPDGSVSVTATCRSGLPGVSNPIIVESPASVRGVEASASREGVKVADPTAAGICVVSGSAAVCLPP